MKENKEENGMDVKMMMTLTEKITKEIDADAKALASKYEEYRYLIAEKIVALAVSKPKYNSLFNEYLKPFCKDRLDVFFCVFCMHYDIFYKQVEEIYGATNCVKMLNGKAEPGGTLHDDICIK